MHARKLSERAGLGCEILHVELSYQPTAHTVRGGGHVRCWRTKIVLNLEDGGEKESIL